MTISTNMTAKRLLILSAALLCSFGLFAQHQVSGTVKDTGGTPLVGVYIEQQGGHAVCVTGADGSYTISVPADAVLLFTYMGKADQKVSVAKRTRVDVTMTDVQNVIDDVVVVGYGQQRKSSMTASISAINGDELLKAPATNVTGLLGGRVAGIASVQESGEPGADAASITIRGSWYGVTYIVDGVPRAIDDVNPNDIASISVLKDASAAAIYGLSSGGGVIIVTTKSGHVGKNTLSYNGTVGISRNANFPKFLNAEQFAWYYNKGREMDWDETTNGGPYTPLFTQAQVALMTNGDDSDGWGDTDWIGEVFGTGVNTKHNITAQGGNETLQYFTSIGYLGQKGNISAYTYEKYNIRSSVVSQIAKNLKMTFMIAGDMDYKSTPGFSSGGSESEGTWMSVARQAIASHPYLPKTYQGYPVATRNNYGQGSSPLAAISESGNNKTQGYGVHTNLDLQYSAPFLKGLTAKVMGSFDHNYSVSKILATPYYVMLASVPTNGSTTMNYSKVIDVRGKTYNTLGEGLYSNTMLLGNASLQYVTTVAGKHHVDAMLLTEIRQETWRGFSAYGKNLPFVELPELGFATPADSPIGGWSKLSRQMGYVGRLRYDYDNKYLVELSGRYDGSYKFSGNVANKRWGFFPAASVGWRASEEEFLKGYDWLDNLKLRASMGEVGVDDVPPYEFLNQYAADTPIYMGGNRVNTLDITTIANLNLTWARTRSYNIGFDATVLNGLFGIEFDVFYTHTYDMLTSMGGQYPPSMGGYYPAYENFSEQDSRGIEAVLTHRKTIGAGSDALNYNVGLNITYAKSRWIKYPDLPNIPSYQCYSGKELGSLLGWVADGLYQTEEEIDNSPWPFGQRPRCGDIKYVDLNGDGFVGYEDKAFTGRSNRPKLIAGLTLGASWHNFDVSMLINGAAFFDISLTGTYFNGYDDNTIFTETFKEGGNSPLYLVENAWREDNKSGTYPRLTVNSPTNNNGLASTFWFRDGKYIRMKSLQFGYNVPKRFCNKVGIDNLRLYVEGSNLFTISGLPQGIDPESPGVNNGYYPQQKTFMGGVSITF